VKGALLKDIAWQVSYGPQDDRLHNFYIPALERAVHYDRSAGYFSSSALAIAAAGVVRLIQNGGRMRLLVGAELSEDDAHALRDGYELDDLLGDRFLESDVFEQALQSHEKRERLAAIAWMVAEGTLDIRVVLPKGKDGKPDPSDESYFHVKNGVFRDAAGHEVGFQGSVNESWRGWEKHYEDLAVYRSWADEDGDTRAHLNLVKQRIDRLWADTEEDWVAVDLPTAVRDRLVEMHKPDQAPRHDPFELPEEVAPPPRADVTQDERILFQFLRDTPHLASASSLAAGTSQVRPWPHQVKVADTVCSRWPEGFLLCDEVGLGKTIEAGLVLRQLILDGRVKRAMVLVPSSVLRQFQEELWEKFTLDLPRYEDGKFIWRGGRKEAPKTDNPWNGQDLFLASSHLAKRKDRRQELVAAKPWDLLMVDEAHHARRKGFQNLDEYRPNNLLALLTELRENERVKSLLLMTATPLQVSPVEVWDLLSLVGMGGRWGAHPQHFLDFFGALRDSTAADANWGLLLGMFRGGHVSAPQAAFVAVARERLGLVRWEHVMEMLESSNPGEAASQLDEEQKRVLFEMLRELTPLSTRVQRNTRSLLRKYRERGLLKEDICTRLPKNEWIAFSPEEASLYEEVEVYISDFYKRYEAQRKGLGFVMTVYRRRLTSSFHALECSLKRRLEFLKTGAGSHGLDDDDLEEASLFDDWDEDLAEAEEFLEQEIEFIEGFLSRIAFMPTDSKVAQLLDDLGALLEHRDSVLVFTQYTDTMDHLRENLSGVYRSAVACYSGRGGEVWDGTVWKAVGKEELKRMFREGEVQVLLGTEAMSEASTSKPVARSSISICLGIPCGLSNASDASTASARSTRWSGCATTSTRTAWRLLSTSV